MGLKVAKGEVFRLHLTSAFVKQDTANDKSGCNQDAENKTHVARVPG
jgi:hypothetical protein